MSRIGTVDEASITPVPRYWSQFATPELVSSALDGKIQPHEDPAWSIFGFREKDEYDYWAPRLCGMICAKMILDAHEATTDRSVADLTEEAVLKGAYDVATDSGWRYAPLIQWAADYGFDGEVIGRLSLDRICAEIIDNRAVIASVHPGVIRGDYLESPTGRKGGHLVVVHGFRRSPSGETTFVIHNPSGRTRITQIQAAIPEDRFSAAFAGRGFTLWKRAT